MEVQGMELPLQDLTELLTRSSCSITSLKLENILMLPEVWMSLLECMPDLRDIHLDELPSIESGEPRISAIMDPFFHRLQGKSSLFSELQPTIFLPRLENFTFKVLAPYFSTRSFVDMVLSRCVQSSEHNAVARLTKVHLHMQSKNFAQGCIALLRNISGGDVRIRLIDRTGRVL
jgi:hypothetical protein